MSRTVFARGLLAAVVGTMWGCDTLMTEKPTAGDRLNAPLEDLSSDLNALFAQIGCAGCHVPTMTTGPGSIPQLSEVEAHLYSDLLLHDLGPELADGRPDGDASGQEFRTAPLWGLRLVPDFLGGQEHYLHDGRATTLEQAIEYHGGEAEAVRQAYRELEEDDRQALIAFLARSSPGWCVWRG